MVELITIIAISYELVIDSMQFKEKGYVNHKRGVLFRLTVMVFLLMMFGVTSLFLFIAVYLIAFDHIMGLIINDDMMHMGTEARWDRVIGKIPELPRLVIRVILSTTLASVYYLPEQWIKLAQEITNLFNT